MNFTKEGAEYLRYCLDFHEVSVWAIKGALEEAYKLGQQNKYFKDT
jgi:hypothetical protein